MSQWYLDYLVLFFTIFFYSNLGAGLDLIFFFFDSYQDLGFEILFKMKFSYTLWNILPGNQEIIWMFSDGIGTANDIVSEGAVERGERSLKYFYYLKFMVS